MSPSSLATRLMRLIPLLVILYLTFYNMKTLGVVFRRMAATAQAMAAQYEMGGIRSSLVAHYVATTKLPGPGQEFEEFVRGAFQPRPGRDFTKDRFGTKYVFFLLRDGSGCPNGFKIVSAGPDRRHRTADDIVVEWQCGI